MSIDKQPAIEAAFRERSGPYYLIAGFRLLRDPQILPFFLIPLLVNITVFTVAIVWSTAVFSSRAQSLVDAIPSWLSFLNWILWPLFILLVVLIVFYGFTLLANLIAAPFNGLLAERVAARVRAPGDFQTTSLAGFLASIPASLLRELHKLLYFGVLALAGLILVLIPAISPFATAIWFVLGAWSLAIEYCDYPADNDGISLRALRSRLRKHRGKALSFGSITMLATMVPVLNMAVMPAAVCGATLLWVETLDSGSAD